MKPIAYIDHVSGKPKLIDAYVIQTPVDIPLYIHAVKELHLSLQKSKQTGELLAVTYTDDEHRIVEVLWQRPPVKELTDEEIHQAIRRGFAMDGFLSDGIFLEIKELLRKAKE